jgi:predicted ATP-grasp superfamily ATP-dependent carboligase
MDLVRWTERPVLRDPLFVIAFEGWNDAGDAATLAVDYLAQEWNATLCASIDPEDFYDFTVTRPTVTTASDGARRIEWPQVELLSAEVPGSRHDIVLLRGAEPQLRWRRFCRAVVSTAEAIHARLIVVLGAMLSDVPHTRPVRVSGTTTDPGLAREVGLSESGYQGPTGIVGVLLEALQSANLPAASFWAAVPHYAHQLPSPKAALALVERSAALVGVPVDPVRLRSAADEYERRVSERVADDEDAAAYVAQLEEAEDNADRLLLLDPEGTPGDGAADGVADGHHATAWAHLPSADELAADVERYLRDQRGGT